MSAAYALLLAACATEPAGKWSVAGALAPARAALDTDHDGRVTGAEYDRVAFQGPPYAAADLDGDLDLDPDELRRVVRDSDPLTFFTPEIPAPDEGRDPRGPGPPLPESMLVLLILREEIVAADPSVPVPHPARLREVGMAGSLGSDAAKVLLAELEVASARAGVAFPNGLRR